MVALALHLRYHLQPMRKNEIPTLSAVVGGNLRRLREHRGLSQDRMANQLGLLGLHWSRATLGAVEQGDRPLAFAEVFQIAATLLEPPAELLKGSGWVRLSEDATADLAALRKILSDPYINIVPTKCFKTPAFDRANAAVARWGAKKRDADFKAAKALGVPADDIDPAAKSVWGQSLTDEREIRLMARAPKGASARSLQALRGHITRELLAELEPALKENH